MYRMRLIGRMLSYLALRPHATIAALWTAPLRARYSLVSHSSRSTVGPSPPIRSVLADATSRSDASFAITFQCPGGVSDRGPSAQNSAATRMKSASLTAWAAYGLPVTGFVG